jgi:hypothetical protein
MGYRIEKEDARGVYYNIWGYVGCVMRDGNDIEKGFG